MQILSNLIKASKPVVITEDQLATMLDGMQWDSNEILDKSGDVVGTWVTRGGKIEITIKPGSEKLFAPYLKK